MAIEDRAGLRATIGPVWEREGEPAAEGSRLAPAEGRKFGLTLAAGFALLAGLLGWRGHAGAALAVAGLGGLLATAAVAIPGRLGPVRRVWFGLAGALGRVTTPLILALVYFIVITPLGVLRRRLGGNPLRHPEVEGSYWVSRGERRQGDLRRQF